MVKWQEVGRVISAVHHHGPKGLKTSEIKKLVKKQPNSRFNFKEALDEAVRTGFLRVRNHRFYPYNWQEPVSKRKRGPRLPRGMQGLSSDSCCTGVETARRRRAPRSRRRGNRSRKHTSSRRRPPRAYTRRRNVKSRGGANSSYASRRRRRSQRPRRKKQVRKNSRSRRRTHARGHRRARVGSNEKLAPDGSNGVTPVEHATGKKYPPR